MKNVYAGFIKIWELNWKISVDEVFLVLRKCTKLYIILSHLLDVFLFNCVFYNGGVALTSNGNRYHLMFIGYMYQYTSICVLYERYERPVSTYTYVHDTCELCSAVLYYTARRLCLHMYARRSYTNMHLLAIQFFTMHDTHIAEFEYIHTHETAPVFVLLCVGKVDFGLRNETCFFVPTQYTYML